MPASLPLIPPLSSKQARIITAADSPHHRLNTKASTTNPAKAQPFLGPIKSAKPSSNSRERQTHQSKLHQMARIPCKSCDHPCISMREAVPEHSILTCTKISSSIIRTNKYPRAAQPLAICFTATTTATIISIQGLRIEFLKR